MIKRTSSNLVIVVLILFLTNLIHGQDSYILMDGLKHNVDLQRVDNFTVKEKHPTDEGKTYSAEEISEYGLYNGKVYKSFILEDMQMNKAYFLEQLVFHTNGVYYIELNGEKRFYLQEEEKMILLPPNKLETFKLLEKYYGKCPDYKNSANRMKFRPGNLKNYIDGYIICDESNLKKIRPGIFAGISLDNFAPNLDESIVVDNLLKSSSNYYFGVSAEFPLGRDFLSLVPAVIYKSYDIFDSSIPELSEVRTTFKSVTIPISLRLTMARAKHAPFIESGVSYTKNFSQNISGFPVSPGVSVPDLILDTYLGLHVGAGMKFWRYNSITPFLKINYSQSWGQNTEDRIANLFVNTDDYLNYKNFSLELGLMF